VLPTAKSWLRKVSINIVIALPYVLSHIVCDLDLSHLFIGMISFIYINSHLPFIGLKIILLTAQNLELHQLFNYVNHIL